ncbi:MAG: peptide chain release factor N(5)-glutamine methyltransferase [Nibricoccus sp.]
MLSLLEILKKTADFFSAKGIEHPRLDAELLVGHALGLKRMQLYLQFERLLTEPELEKIRPLVRRRSQREPLQYILGEAEWFGLKLKVDKRVLIPRPETELLAELVTQALPTAPSRILDLGTGSGALALGLAKHWPDARAVAVDRSADALAVARENTVALAMGERVEFVESDWFSALPPEAKFDLIVANPPYLTDAETQSAAPEVRDFEPHTALIAAEEGLSDLRKIVEQSRAFLSPTGVLAMETGIAHHAALAQLCQAASFGRVESKQDLTGRDRFVLAWAS